MVDGKWYVNDANLDVNIPSAVGAGNTRIDRIVLRANWAGYEVAVTRIAGTDAASPTWPAITQISGTTYDILLCRVLVTTAGVVTVTDERVWALPGAQAALSVLGRASNSAGKVASIAAASDGWALRRSGIFLSFGQLSGLGIANDAIDSQHYAAGSIDGEHIANDAIDSQHYATGSIDGEHIANDAIDSQHYAAGSIDLEHMSANSVDATKIVNRTRTDFVPAITPNPEAAGCVLPDSASTSAYGYWQVPADYVSSMVVKALVIAAALASGNIYAKNDVVIETSLATSNYGAEAVTSGGYAKVRTVTIVGSPSAGDGVYMKFTRDATHANDTVNAVCVILGWQVSYTADS